MELFPSLLDFIAENDVCNFENVFIHNFELGNKMFYKNLIKISCFNDFAPTCLSYKKAIPFDSLGRTIGCHQEIQKSANWTLAKAFA